MKITFCDRCGEKSGFAPYYTPTITFDTNGMHGHPLSFEKADLCEKCFCAFLDLIPKIYAKGKTNS